MSYRGEVIADSSGTWAGNGCYYATREEAHRAVVELSGRWTSVRETRVVETEEPVNVRWNDATGKTEFLPKEQAA